MKVILLLLPARSNQWSPTRYRRWMSSREIGLCTAQQIVAYSYKTSHSICTYRLIKLQWSNILSADSRWTQCHRYHIIVEAPLCVSLWLMINGFVGWNKAAILEFFFSCQWQNALEKDSQFNSMHLPTVLAILTTFCENTLISMNLIVRLNEDVMTDYRIVTDAGALSSAVLGLIVVVCV